MIAQTPAPKARRDTVGVTPTEMAQAELDALVRYWDIIDLPAWEPKTHARQPADVRAAQFSPFAALTGYEAEVAEVARLTERERTLGEDARAELEEALLEVGRALARGERPEVELTRFVPDARKEGGAYETLRGRVHYVDDEAHALVLEGGGRAALDSLFEVRLAPSPGGRGCATLAGEECEAPGPGADEGSTSCA